MKFVFAFIFKFHSKYLGNYSYIRLYIKKTHTHTTVEFISIEGKFALIKLKDNAIS